MGFLIAKCPECGDILEVLDDGRYHCESCDNYFEDYEVTLQDEDDYDDDEVPNGCKACGGPYPSCKTSCSIFDD